MTTPTQMQWHDVRRYTDDGPGIFRHFEDGTVIAFRRERDSSVPGSWLASAWDKDPQENKDAVHIGHVGCDATMAELRDSLNEWARGEHYLQKKRAEKEETT